MKNSTPNSLPSNQMMPPSSTFPTQNMVGGIHQMAPVNRAQPTVPMSNQNGAVGVSVGTAKQAPPTTAGEPQKLKQEGQGGQQNGQQGTTQQTTSVEQTSTASPTEPTSPADQQQTLANTKEKTPMCLINELARYNKVKLQCA